jgi:hypothetical protein
VRTHLHITAEQTRQLCTRLDLDDLLKEMLEDIAMRGVPEAMTMNYIQPDQIHNSLARLSNHLRMLAAVGVSCTVVSCVADSGQIGGKPPSQPSAEATPEPVPEDGLPVQGVYDKQVEEVSNDCPSKDVLSLDIPKTAAIFALDRPDKKFRHLRWISVPFWGTGMIDLTRPEPQL